MNHVVVTEGEGYPGFRVRGPAPRYAFATTDAATEVVDATSGLVTGLARGFTIAAPGTPESRWHEVTVAGRAAPRDATTPDERLDLTIRRSVPEIVGAPRSHRRGSYS